MNIRFPALLKQLASVALAIVCPAAPAVAQTSPAPYTSAQRYDAMYRVTGTISADPDTIGTGNPFIAVRNSYDAAGRLTKVETGTLSAWQSESVAPSAWPGFTVYRRTETSYDAMGRKLRETLAEGASGPVRSLTQYSYDAVGRLDCAAVRMNPADFASPPASACTQGTGGEDRITRNFYDAADQRVQLREGVGTAMEAAEATWAYNLNGQVTTVIDANGNQTALVYDGHGRQNCWMFPSTTGPGSFNDASQATALSTAGALSGTITNGHCLSGLRETYLSDPNGNRTNLTKRDGSTIAYSYDALNRVIVKTPTQAAARIGTAQELTSAQTRPVYYAYDLRGLQTAARFDSLSGEGVTNAWDGFGRLASSSTSLGGTTRTLLHGYDRNGNRTHLVHPDSTGFVSFYDNLNRLTSLHDGVQWRTAHYYLDHGASDATVRSNHVYTFRDYDGVQRPWSLSHRHLPTYAGSDVVWTFAHNLAGQLAAETRDNDAYGYAGHVSGQQAYAANGLNQYDTVGGVGQDYDDNGNLISDGTNSYVYDVENRLVGRSNGNVALAYDPLGRLYRVSSPTTDTRFLYDGDALALEYNAAGTVTRRYAHAMGADVPLLSYGGSGLATPTWLHADRQGSIVGISDASTATTQVNSYDEYGVPAAGNDGRFQYTGQIWLPEIGLYHYKARVYAPRLGRFLQTDPIGYDDQFNLYAYVGNDPVNRNDPSGKRECSGFVDCVVAVLEERAESSTVRGTLMRGLIAGAATGVGGTWALDTIVRNVREDVVIDVYRVFDGEKALQNGRSWTLEDPRQMTNWRDRLAVYPEWNDGTLVVHGTITMQDLHDGKVDPGPGPHSTAGPRPADSRLGGGPYRGNGNEIRIRDSATTVRNQTVQPMCGPAERRNRRGNC